MADILGSAVGRLVQMYCASGARGRYRLANMFGSYLPDHVVIGGIEIPLDLSVSMYRYIAAGMYEENNVRHWQKVVRHGDVFIDAGANVGYVSAVAADLVGVGGRVIAIEASPTCLARLRQYLIAPNIELVAAAISDAEGTAVFCDTPRVIEKGYGALASIETPADAVQTVVPTVTVDGLLRQRSLTEVRYLKLDVEGAELLALQGAMGSLSGGAIHYVLTEMTYIDYCAEISRGVEALMEKFGYSPYVATPRGDLVPVNLRSYEGSRIDAIWSRQST